MKFQRKRKMASRSGCHSLDGTEIPEGGNFVPGPDMCTMCKCKDGKANFCRSVLCMSPTDCEFFKKGNLCCDYICLDDKNSSSDLGLRMVGSAMTAILSLGLLLFLIHRLRQRKLRAAQHQYFSEQLDAINAIPIDTFSSNACCHSAAYFASNDQVNAFINGATPPYSPWKASLYFQNKQPPPSYNEAVATDYSRYNPERQSVVFDDVSLSNVRPRAAIVNSATNESGSSTQEASVQYDEGYHLCRLPYVLQMRPPTLPSDQVYEISNPEAASSNMNPLPSVPNRHSEEHESSLREACDARHQALDQAERHHNRNRGR